MVGFFVVGNAVIGFCVGALVGFLVGLAVGLRVGLNDVGCLDTKLLQCHD